MVWKLYQLLSVILATVNVSNTVQEEVTRKTPDLPLALCTTDSAIELFFGMSPEACIKECDRRSLCQSINYNRYNLACILREHSTLPVPEHETTNAPSICYHITMHNSTSTKSCKGRPCDRNSYCQANDESPLGYDCRLTYCSSPPGVRNARALSGVPTKVDNNNTYVCNAGYTLFGLATIRCLENATWSEVEMFCYPNCPAIPEPAGTFVTSRSTYHLSINTTVIYACSERYYNLTEPNISCNEHGDWSKFACTPYCKLSTLEETLTYAEFLSVPQGPYNNTAVVTFKCTSGYYNRRLGPTPSAQCLTTGRWNVTGFVCIPHCVHDGLHVYGGEHEIVNHILLNKHASATFRCLDVYHPYLITTSESGLIAKCQSTGTLLTSGYCFKYCGNPPDVYWAHIDENSSQPYKVLSYEQYKCDDFACSDNMRKTCHYNGVCCAWRTYHYGKKTDSCVSNLG